jgi:hypothetical protein
MIGWHEVVFYHQRENGRARVRCVACGNTRLEASTPWLEVVKGANFHHPSYWLSGERKAFSMLREMIAQESGEAEAVDARIEELEAEIEAMRVTDPTELAAQLLNMKVVVDAAKNLSSSVMQLLWDEGDGTVQPFIEAVKAFKEQEETRNELDIKMTGSGEMVLPEGKEEQQYEPRVQRSEPGGYAEPEGKLRGNKS